MQAYEVWCRSGTFKGTLRYGERPGPIRRGETVETIRHQRVKLLIAGAIASGLLATGAMAAVAIGQQQPGTVTGSTMNIGGTAVTTTPPTVEPTTKAEPVMKAGRPRGF